MSRSFKKHPFCGDCPTVGKRLANGKVRAMMRGGKTFADGSNYKKAYCQYDIRDWGWSRTWQQEVEGVNRDMKKFGHAFNPRSLTDKRDEPDWKALYRHWYRTMKGK